ncbi:cyclic nucleotide-binding domain protein (macronuclear) [Tetrahymena thermophila SB210]|uniref:Cyclic nucleotide-binding domain protein n=1 Tax=Tetrahymena thermophila (strain SB210) TaxID=312017 RepID=W7X989_TETTS|nr:cyclic nucleotide-binding domain protein [Tetrahymena thermophila SB210]EWS72953.1 cyclic nucleotide-binding domain protein [Tetrahymena thermophila SB210]|eukprot:XP_012654520.1 cyclic nucleotide-binding domain protein [Tetrahymena thermophila SB210]
MEFCKFLRYVKIDKGQIIQNFNNRVESLFFLICGRVKQTESEKKLKKNNQIMRFKNEEIIDKFIIFDSNQQKDQVIYSFPNVEFITHNICKSKYETLEDCYFATISYKEFEQIMSKTKIFDQESAPDYWYIIRQGEFSLQRCFEIETSKRQQQNDMMVQFKQAKSFTQTQSISILQQNEFFGIEDILSNKKRQYSVKCLSEQGVLSVISSKEIVKLMNRNILIQIDIQRIFSEKTNFIQERINQIEQQLIQSQIKKIEIRSKNISTQNQVSTVNQSKDNMEKIQQVEDMLQIQEQYSKIHTTNGTFQASEDLDEQIEIQKFLKLKGFNSLSTHQQPTQAQEQNKRIYNENFKKALKNDKILRNDTLKQKQELLNFYRKMIEDQFSTQKQKQSSKGFKNYKINFFNQKVIQPMQEALKKKNNKILRKMQNDKQHCGTNFNNFVESRSQSQYSQIYSSPINLLKNSFLQNQSSDQGFQYYCNTSDSNLFRQSGSSNSLEFFIKNRKIKSSNPQSEFSSTFYSQSSEPNQFNDLDAANLSNFQTSPNLRSLIKRAIQNNYQNESQLSSNIFVNYGDRFKNLSHQLNSISLCTQFKSEKQSQSNFKVSTKISRLNSIGSPTQKEDSSSEQFQNTSQSIFYKSSTNNFKTNQTHLPQNLTQKYYNQTSYNQKNDYGVSLMTEDTQQKKSISFSTQCKANHFKPSVSAKFPTQPESPSYKNQHQ